ncbi:OprD family outer membrane porin [Pseudomonas putida]
MSFIKTSVTLGAALYSCIALSAQTESDGIIEGSTARLLLRNYYFNRDFRDSPSDKQSYREEWAQGLMTFFSSGYTPGLVGLGFDVYALLGVKLDSGRGTSGTGLLPLGERGQAEDNYSSAGAALKVQISSTQLRFGRQQVDAPVFATADTRLLPETATGLLVSSQEWDGLRLELGLFIGFSGGSQALRRRRCPRAELVEHNLHPARPVVSKSDDGEFGADPYHGDRQ